MKGLLERGIVKQVLRGARRSRKTILRNFTKITTVITISCFMLTGVLGQAIAAISEIDSSKIISADQFKNDFIIPSNYGRITQGKYFGSGKVVINIQDLHCHPEVQRNISKILAILDKKSRLSCLFLEGASGEVDTSWLTSISDKNLKKQIVETLLSKGELTGIEYFSVNSKNKCNIRGLENEELYKENSLRLQEITANKNEIDLVVKEVRKKLNQVKSLYYNEKQKNLEKSISKHRAGKMESGKYYTLLNKSALNLNIDVEGYTNIVGFLGLLDRQKDLKYKNISRQMQQLVMVLKQRLPYKAYNELLEKTKDLSKSDQLYVYLEKVVRQNNIDTVRDFPDLNKFFSYVDASQQVNPVNLLKEENRLLMEVNITLSGNDSERDVVFLMDFMRRFEDYFANKITAEDYGYFSKNLEEFKLLYKNYTNSNAVAGLEDSFNVLNTYYKVNIERNQWFIKNIFGDEFEGAAKESSSYSFKDDIEKVIASLENNSDVNVVVTGGFHTQELENIYAEKGISYLTITPNVTEGTQFSDIVYGKMLEEQNKIFSQALAVKALSTKPYETQAMHLAGAALFAQLENEDLDFKDLENRINTLNEWGKKNGIEFKLSGRDQEGNFEFNIKTADKTFTYVYNKNNQTTQLVDESGRTGESTGIMAEIEKELEVPGSGKLPFYGSIYDIHGGYLKLTEFISELFGIEINAEKSPVAQGITVRSMKLLAQKKIKLIIGGDIPDRGKGGVLNSFRLIRTITESKLGEYILGNHDEWAFMNMLGLHLPWYKGFKGVKAGYMGYDGKGGFTLDIASIIKEKQDQEAVGASDINHWAKVLKDYMDYADKRQKDGPWKDLEADIKKIFEDSYGFKLDSEAGKDVLNKLDKNEKTESVFNKDESLRQWWASVMGRNVGILVYTGVRATDKMSINWWVDRREELNKIRGNYTEINDTWDKLEGKLDEIINSQKEKMSEELAKETNNWEWSVIDAIMYRNYESAEWWALDWIYHKGWGGLKEGLLSEINKELESKREKLLTTADYFAHPDIIAMRDFYIKNANLYKRDEYGRTYLHSFFPVNDEGDVCIGRVNEDGFFEREDKDSKLVKGFDYKGKHYEGKDIFKGFDQISNDIKSYKPGVSNLADIYEAFVLLNSIYADLTTKIKPADLQRYKKIGFRKILDKIGVNTLFIGHNPIKKLEAKDIKVGEVDDEGNLKLVSMDDEMSSGYAKPNGKGSYITVGRDGINMVRHESGEPSSKPVKTTLVEDRKFLEGVLANLKSEARQERLENIIKTAVKPISAAAGVLNKLLPEVGLGTSSAELEHVKFYAKVAYDSRGTETIEVTLTIGNLQTKGDVPAGASKGEDEAQTVSIEQARENVKEINRLINLKIEKEELDLKKHEDLVKIDRWLADNAGKNFAKWGANATVPISRALWNMVAKLNGLELDEYISKNEPDAVSDKKELVYFLMNIFNGGLHALKTAKGEVLGKDRIDIQEIMIAPVGAKSYAEALEMGDKIDFALKQILSDKFNKEEITRADEAGFSVKGLGDSSAAIEYVFEAIEKAGYQPGKDVKLCLDVAASSFYKGGKYEFMGGKLDSDAMINYYIELAKKYAGKIISIEDGLDENDWKGWQKLNTEMQKLGIETIGDDLFVTQHERLQKGIDEKSASAILIKVNQNGTMLGTLEVIKQAKKARMAWVVSHRSGETMDATIADLAYATNAMGLKSGDPQPDYDFKEGDYTERPTVRRVKYERMVEIEARETLGKSNREPALDILTDEENLINEKMGVVETILRKHFKDIRVGRAFATVPKDTRINGDDKNRAPALDLVSGSAGKNIEIPEGMDGQKNPYQYLEIPLSIPASAISDDLRKEIDKVLEKGGKVGKNTGTLLQRYFEDILKGNVVFGVEGGKQIKSHKLNGKEVVYFDAKSLRAVPGEDGSLAVQVHFYIKSVEGYKSVLDTFNSNLQKELVIQIEQDIAREQAEPQKAWHEGLAFSNSKEALDILARNYGNFLSEISKGNVERVVLLTDIINALNIEDMVDANGIFLDKEIGEFASFNDKNADVPFYGKNLENFIKGINTVKQLSENLYYLTAPEYNTAKKQGISRENAQNKTEINELENSIIKFYYNSDQFFGKLSQDYKISGLFEGERAGVGRSVTVLNKAIREKDALEINGKSADNIIKSLAVRGITLNEVEQSNLEKVISAFEDKNWIFDMLILQQILGEENFVKVFRQLKVDEPVNVLPSEKFNIAIDGSGRIATMATVLKFASDVNSNEKNYKGKYALRTRKIKGDTEDEKFDSAVSEVKKMFNDQVIATSGLTIEVENGKKELLSNLLKENKIIFTTRPEKEVLAAKQDFVTDTPINSVYPVSIKYVSGSVEKVLGTIYFVDVEQFKNGMKETGIEEENIPRPIIVVDGGKDIYFGLTIDATPGGVDMGDGTIESFSKEIVKELGLKFKSPTLWESLGINKLIGIFVNNDGKTAINNKKEDARLREIIKQVNQGRLGDENLMQLLYVKAQITTGTRPGGGASHNMGDNLHKVPLAGMMGTILIDPASCSTNGASYFGEKISQLFGFGLRRISEIGTTFHMYTSGTDKKEQFGHISPQSTGAAEGKVLNLPNFFADYTSARVPTGLKDGETDIVGGSIFDMLIKTPYAMSLEDMKIFLRRVGAEFPDVIKIVTKEDLVDGSYRWEDVISGQKTGSIVYIDEIDQLDGNTFRIFVGYDNEMSYSFKMNELIEGRFELMKREQYRQKMLDALGLLPDVSVASEKSSTDLYGDQETKELTAWAKEHFSKLTIMEMIEEFGDDLKGKTIVVRVDHNSWEKDDTRVKESVADLTALSKAGAKVVIMTHAGRPRKDINKLVEKGKSYDDAKIEVAEKVNLGPLSIALRDFFPGINIHFNKGFLTTADASDVIKEMKDGDFMLLDNVRLNAAEESLSEAKKKVDKAVTEVEKSKADKGLKKASAEFNELSEKMYGEAFASCNLSISVLHRDQASVTGSRIYPNMLRVAGRSVVKELKLLKDVEKNAEVIAFGGSKVSEKIKAIRNLGRKSNVKKLIIFGAMANAFFVKLGIETGASIGVDAEQLDTAADVLSDPVLKSKIHLPADVVVVPGTKIMEIPKDVKGITVRINYEKNSAGEYISAKLEEGVIPENWGDEWMIVDIGPESVAQNHEIIQNVKKGKAIFWNGVTGAGDILKTAKAGTKGFVESLVAAIDGVLIVAGGGDTLPVLAEYDKDGKIMKATGGGSSLEILSNQEMPGIDSLSNRKTAKASRIIANILPIISAAAGVILISGKFVGTAAAMSVNPEPSIWLDNVINTSGPAILAFIATGGGIFLFWQIIKGLQIKARLANFKTTSSWLGLLLIAMVLPGDGSIAEGAKTNSELIDPLTNQSSQCALIKLFNDHYVSKDANNNILPTQKLAGQLETFAAIDQKKAVGYVSIDGVRYYFLFNRGDESLPHVEAIGVGGQQRGQDSHFEMPFKNLIYSKNVEMKSMNNDMLHTIIIKPIENFKNNLVSNKGSVDILSFNEADKEDVELIGGKGASLSEMSSGVRVTNGYSTTAHLFRRLIDANPNLLKNYIETELMNLDAGDHRKRETIAREIEERFTSPDLVVPMEVKAEIEWNYILLCLKDGKAATNTDGIACAVRSSGLSEDSVLYVDWLGESTGSEAGQGNTDLNVRGLDNIWRSYLNDAAALFSSQAISYRDTQIFLNWAGKTGKNDFMEMVDLLRELQKKEMSDDENLRIVLSYIGLEKPKAAVTKKMKNALQALLNSKMLSEDETKKAKVEKLINSLQNEQNEFVNPQKMGIGVVVMKMVQSKVAGTAFSLNSVTGFTGKSYIDSIIKMMADDGYKRAFPNAGLMKIDASWGLGEAVVSNLTIPDNYIVFSLDGIHWTVLEQTLGAKENMIVYIEEAMELFKGTLTPYKIKKLAEILGPTIGMDPKVVVPSKYYNELSDVFYFNHEEAIALINIVRAVNAGKNPKSVANMNLVSDKLGINQEKSDTSLSDLANIIAKTYEGKASVLIKTPENMREKFVLKGESLQRIARLQNEILLHYKKVNDNPGELRDNEWAIEYIEAGKFNDSFEIPEGFNVAGKVLGAVEGLPVALQSRPYTTMNLDMHPTTVNIDNFVVNDVWIEANKPKVLAKGIAVTSAAKGVVRWINLDEGDIAEQFTRFDENTIMVVKMATPDLDPAMKAAGGVISEQGGNTSHAAIFCREAGIACIVGMGEVEGILKDGMEITIDGNNGVIYEGMDIPIIKEAIRIETTMLPSDVNGGTGLIQAGLDNAEGASPLTLYSGFYGNSLTRIEFAVLEMGIYPPMGWARDILKQLELSEIDSKDTAKLYDGLSKEQKALVDILRENQEEVYAKRLTDKSYRGKSVVEEIDEQIKGYVSFENYCTEKMRNYTNRMSLTLGIRMKNLMRKFDNKANESLNLIGAKLLAEKLKSKMDPEGPGEADEYFVGQNPLLGNRGEALLNNQNYAKAFSPILRGQLLAVKDQSEMLEDGIGKKVNNNGVMFVFVRTPDELRAGLQEMENIIAEPELGESARPNSVGMMVEVNSAVWFIDEMLEIIKEYKSKHPRTYVYLSFGTNDLTNLTFRADRDDPKIQKLPINPATGVKEIVLSDGRVYKQDGNGILEVKIDEGSPVVIEQIKHVVSRAKAAGVACGLCGQAIVNLIERGDFENAIKIISQLDSNGVDIKNFVTAAMLRYDATMALNSVKSEESLSKDLFGSWDLEYANDKTKGKKVVNWQSQGALNSEVVVINSDEDLRQLENRKTGDYIVFIAGPISSQLVLKEKLKIDLHNLVYASAIVISDELSVNDLGFIVKSHDSNGDPVLDMNIASRIKVRMKLVVEKSKVAGGSQEIVLSGVTGKSIKSGSKVTLDYNTKTLLVGKHKFNIADMAVEEINIPSKVEEPGAFEIGSTIKGGDIQKDINIHPLIFKAYDEGNLSGLIDAKRIELLSEIGKEVAKIDGKDKRMAKMEELADMMNSKWKSDLGVYNAKTGKWDDKLSINSKIKKLVSESSSKTAMEYFKNTYSNKMKKAYSSVNKAAVDKAVVYETTSLTRKEYSAMQGGRIMELAINENPLYGEVGAARNIEDMWIVYETELEIFKKLRIKNKNLALQITDLRNETEAVLNANMQVLKKLGLEPGKDGLMVGINIASQADVLGLNTRYAGYGLSFVTVNEDLPFSLLAVDPNYPGGDIVGAEYFDSVLESPMKIIKAGASKNNILMNADALLNFVKGKSRSKIISLSDIANKFAIAAVLILVVFLGPAAATVIQPEQAGNILDSVSGFGLGTALGLLGAALVLFAENILLSKNKKSSVQLIIKGGLLTVAIGSVFIQGLPIYILAFVWVLLGSYATTDLYRWYRAHSAASFDKKLSKNTFDRLSQLLNDFDYNEKNNSNDEIVQKVNDYLIAFKQEKNLEDIQFEITNLTDVMVNCKITVTRKDITVVEYEYRYELEDNIGVLVKKSTTIESFSGLLSGLLNEDKVKLRQLVHTRLIELLEEGVRKKEVIDQRVNNYLIFFKGDLNELKFESTEDNSNNTNGFTITSTKKDGTVVINVYKFDYSSVNRNYVVAGETNLKPILVKIVEIGKFMETDVSLIGMVFGVLFVAPFVAILQIFTGNTGNGDDLVDGIFVKRITKKTGKDKMLKILKTIGYEYDETGKTGTITKLNNNVLLAELPGILQAAIRGENGEVKAISLDFINAAAVVSDLVLSSMFEEYANMAAAAGKNIYTIPAINVRTNAFQTLIDIFNVAIENGTDMMVFELALSEKVYTAQPPAIYKAEVLAAAMMTGYKGKIYLQADHYQMNPDKYVENPTAARAEIFAHIDEAVENHHGAIDQDNSMIVALPVGMGEIIEDLEGGETETAPDASKEEKLRKMAVASYKKISAAFGKGTMSEIKNKVKTSLVEHMDAGFYSTIIEETNGKIDETKDTDKLNALKSLRDKITDFENQIKDADQLDKLAEELMVEQVLNAKETAIGTVQIRGKEKDGIISVIGGEIGEIGGKNSEPGEFVAYVELYNVILEFIESNIKAGSDDALNTVYNVLGENEPIWKEDVLDTVKEKLRYGPFNGLSKIAVQLGTAHGVGGDIDFPTLRTLSKLAKKYLLIDVLHGSSKVKLDKYGSMVENGAGEVHLATLYMEMVIEAMKTYINGKDASAENRKVVAGIYMTLEDFAVKSKYKKDHAGLNAEEIAARRATDAAGLKVVDYRKGLYLVQEDIDNLPADLQKIISGQNKEVFTTVFKNLNIVNRKVGFSLYEGALGFVNKILKRAIFAAGNWKLNKNTRGEAVELAETLKKNIGDVSDVEMLVIPPSGVLHAVGDVLKDSNILVGGQNVNAQDKGAFTGETSLDTILDAGGKYALIGHSERRSIFGETDKDIQGKITAALAKGIIPVVCVGETLEEREAGLTAEVIERQIKSALEVLNSKQVSKVIFAYEPVWAIGTGKVATPAQAEEVHAQIRTLINGQFSESISQKTRILYGGSVTEDTVVSLVKMPNIDGALIGGASLKPVSFTAIVNNVVELIKIAFIDAQQQVQDMITIANGKAVRTAVQGTLSEPEYALKGTLLDKETSVAVYQEVNDSVRKELVTRANLGMNAVAVALATGVQIRNERKYIGNIIVPFKDSRESFNVWAEDLETENGKASILIIDNTNQGKGRMDEMQLLGLGTKVLISKMMEEGEPSIAYELRLMASNPDRSPEKVSPNIISELHARNFSDPKILEIFGSYGLFAFPNAVTPEVDNMINYAGRLINERMTVVYTRETKVPKILIGASAIVKYNINVDEPKGQIGEKTVAVDVAASLIENNDAVQVEVGKRGRTSHVSPDEEKDFLLSLGAAIERKNNEQLFTRVKPGVALKISIEQMISRPYRSDEEKGKITNLKGYVDTAKELGFDAIELSNLFGWSNIDMEGGVKADMTAVPSLSERRSTKYSDWFSEFAEFEKSKLADSMKKFGTDFLYGEWVSYKQLQEQLEYANKQGVDVFFTYPVDYNGINIEILKQRMALGFNGVRLDFYAKNGKIEAEVLADLKAQFPVETIKIIPVENNDAKKEMLRKISEDLELIFVEKYKLGDDPSIYLKKGGNIALEMVGEGDEFVFGEFTSEEQMEKVLDRLLNSEAKSVTILGSVLSGYITENGQFQDRVSGQTRFPKMVISKILTKLIKMRIMEPTNPALMIANAYRKGLGILTGIETSVSEKVLNLLLREQKVKVGEKYISSSGLSVIPKTINYAEALTEENRGIILNELAETENLFKAFNGILRNMIRDAGLSEKDNRKMLSALDYANSINKKAAAAEDVVEKIKYNKMLSEYVNGMMVYLVDSKYGFGDKKEFATEKDREAYMKIAALAYSSVASDSKNGISIMNNEEESDMDMFFNMISFQGTLLKMQRYDEAKELLIESAGQIMKWIDNNQLTEERTKGALMFVESLYKYKETEKELIFTKLEGGRTIFGVVAALVETYDKTAQTDLLTRALYYNAASILSEYGTPLDIVRQVQSETKSSIVRDLENLGYLGSANSIVALSLSHNGKLISAERKEQLLSAMSKLLTPYGIKENFKADSNVLPWLMGYYVEIVVSIMSDQEKSPAEVQSRILEILRPLMYRAAEEGGLPGEISAKAPFEVADRIASVESIAELFRILDLKLDPKMPTLQEELQDSFEEGINNATIKTMLGAA